MNKQLKLSQISSLIILGGGLLLGQAAQAALTTFNGTLAFAPLGNITYTGPNLAGATSITLPALEIVSGLAPTYRGFPNDFIAGPGPINLAQLVTVAPLTLNLPLGGPILGYVQLTGATTPVNRYVFDMTSLTTSTSGPQFLNVEGLGVLHDLGGFYGDTPAEFSASFNTVGGNVGGSFTLNSPYSQVPEPTTVVAGIGALGLVLAAFRARR